MNHFSEWGCWSRHFLDLCPEILYASWSDYRNMFVRYLFFPRTFTFIVTVETANRFIIEDLFYCTKL